MIKSVAKLDEYLNGLNFSINMDNAFQTALDSTISQHLYSPSEIHDPSEKTLQSQALSISCINCDPVITNPINITVLEA